MLKGNAKKAAILGQPFGTASARLRKAVMFHLAGRLGLDICYRCDKAIESVADFSMEHTVAWQSSDDPVAAFFDVSAIAFSHLSCNSGAAVRPNRVYPDKAAKIRERNRLRYADPIRRANHLAQKRVANKRARTL